MSSLPSQLLPALLIFTTLWGTAEAADPAWPQFRGMHGNGVADASGLPETWGGLLDAPVWETRLPGIGWSSPVVTGKRVYLTSAETTALSEAEQKERLAATKYSDQVNLQADREVDCYLLEVHADTGKPLRRIKLISAKSPKPIHAHNGYATPTPVIDQQHVYCHFGSLGTVAVSQKTGKVLWRRQFPIDDISGPAASPLLHENLLILVRDGCDQQHLIALDKTSGKMIWKTARPQQPDIQRQYRRSFVTPLVIQVDGKPQLIAPTSNWAISYNPETGDEIWRARLPNGHALVPRPVYAERSSLGKSSTEGLVYVCTGYYKPQLLAISPHGTGDVTKSHVRWRHSKQAPALASPVVADGLLYTVSDIGIANCFDASTGEVLWRERLDGTFAASPLLADNKLYFFSREGTTYVLRPGRDFQLLAENRLSGTTMATPAIYMNSLLIRAGVKLYRIQADP